MCRNTAKRSGSAIWVRIIHQGFDRLELSIEANIPPELFAYLDPEREKAEEARAPVPISYGGVEFDLAPNGIQGYRFQLRGGPMEVLWFFKKPNARDPWGIRIIVGSTLLATQGLGYARAYIDKTLERLGVRYGAHPVHAVQAMFHTARRHFKENTSTSARRYCISLMRLVLGNAMRDSVESVRDACCSEAKISDMGLIYEISHIWSKGVHLMKLQSRQKDF